MRILHHWPLDPFSREARLALAEKGLSFELCFNKPWSAESDAARLNPSARTPVLVETGAGGETVVCEARAILEYLEETRPEPMLLPGDAAGRAEVRRLVAWFEVKFDAEVNAYLLHEKLEKRAQGLGAPDPAAIRQGRDHLRWHFEHLAFLLESRDGLAGPRYTMADVAGAAHLSCIDYLGDAPWDDFEPVKAWYQRVKCRPAFRALLEDRLPGVEPSAHYADLDF